MEREVLKEPKFSEEIVGIVRSGMDKEAVIEQLRDYHENDIAPKSCVFDKSGKKTFI